MQAERRHVLRDVSMTGMRALSPMNSIAAEVNPGAMRSVLVTHPGLQHAHQLALALHERQLLKAFWSGIPVATPGASLSWWLPPGYRQRIRRVDIPASLRRHPLRFQLMMRALSKVQDDSAGDRIHRIFHWFDAWTARRVHALRPKVVVAYENAAYHTFAAARAIGARCVLDAAAFHHATARRLLQPRMTPYTPEVNRRKDEEVRMADLILTCSPLAAESYIENGIAPDKLRPLLLGAEVPSGTDRGVAPRVGPARFVFAGSLSRLKSIDTICSAFSRLHAEGFAYELEFVGGVAEPQWLQRIAMTPNARHRPSVPQTELYPILASADCLLLPSRYDSFGMVVAEAMACGTPALVSTQTGAKAIIESFPGSGWIVEPELEALHRLLRRLVSHPALMRQARPAARDAAREFSWTRYRERAGLVFEEFVR